MVWNGNVAVLVMALANGIVVANRIVVVNGEVVVNAVVVASVVVGGEGSCRVDDDAGEWS